MKDPRLLIDLFVVLVACTSTGCGSGRRFNESCLPYCADGLVCHGRPARCGLAPGSCLADGDCRSPNTCSFSPNQSVGRCTLSSGSK